MKKWFRKHFKPYMIRPAVYKTFTRFIYALLVSLLWEKFVSSELQSRMYAFIFFGALFGVLAWMAYLRLDGVRMPKLPDWARANRKKPGRSFGDIADYVDEDVVSFEELEEEEKDVCILIANLVCCVVFFALSFL